MPLLRSTVYRLLLSTACVLFLAGCGDSDSGGTAPNGTPEEPAAHDHSHDQGPHGGALVLSADGTLHFEVLHHMGEGRVDLFVLDADLKPLAADAAPTLHLVGDDGAVAVTKGADGCWTFRHPLLDAHPKGRFRIAAGGTTHMADLAHDPSAHAAEHAGHEGHEGDEDHAGHDHDADHADDHDDHDDHDGHDGHDHDGE